MTTHINKTIVYIVCILCRQHSTWWTTTFSSPHWTKHLQFIQISLQRHASLEEIKQHCHRGQAASYNASDLVFHRIRSLDLFSSPCMLQILGTSYDLSSHQYADDIQLHWLPPTSTGRSNHHSIANNQKFESLSRLIVDEE